MTELLPPIQPFFLLGRLTINDLPTHDVRDVHDVHDVHDDDLHHDELPRAEKLKRTGLQQSSSR